MDHRVVDGNAGAGGESAIVQERRSGALLHDKIVYGLVNLLGGDAGPYHFPCQGTGCRGNFTGLAHRLQLMFILN